MKHKYNNNIYIKILLFLQYFLLLLLPNILEITTEWKPQSKKVFWSNIFFVSFRMILIKLHSIVKSEDINKYVIKYFAKIHHSLHLKSISLLIMFKPIQLNEIINVSSCEVCIIHKFNFPAFKYSLSIQLQIYYTQFNNFFFKWRTGPLKPPVLIFIFFLLKNIINMLYKNKLELTYFCLHSSRFSTSPFNCFLAVK